MVENGATAVAETEHEHQKLTSDNEKLSDNANTNPSNEDNNSLPSNCLPLVHQVAGHFYGKGRTKLGLLQSNDGLVLKPVQSPPRGEREHNFFKRIFQTADAALNKDEIELRKFLPTYRGSFIHNNNIYIKMDDMAHGIKYPAVIDLKLGRITHDPEATPEKIQRQKSKYPPVERIGFQLIGMRVFDNKTNTFLHYDKVFGRALSEEDLIHGLALYYQFHQTAQIRAIQEAVHKFEDIKSWFERQRTYHFYSSSIIVIYEAYLEEMLNEIERNDTKKVAINTEKKADSNNNNGSDSSFVNNLSMPTSFGNVKIVMADFAHVFPANGLLDQNYLFGLEKLIEHHRILLRSDYKFKDVRLE